MQNELKGLLLKKCELVNGELKNDVLENMFGMYANSEKEFQLMRGERLLLQEIATNLNIRISTDGIDILMKHFEAPKKYKVDRSDTDVFDFGVFYSKKRPRAKASSNKDDLRATCFEKLKSFFESFSKLKPVRPITADIVREIIETGSGFRADIICVFCGINDCEIDALLKTHSIAYTNRSWNLSNFRKHMKHQHCKEIPFPSEIECSEETVSTSTAKNNTRAADKNTALTLDVLTKKPESTPSVQSPTLDPYKHLTKEKIMSMPIVIGDTSTNPNDSNITANDRSLNCIYYDQFSSQNLKLIEAGLKNMEVKGNMQMMIDGQNHNVNITEMKKDGNCMFGTIVHQLRFVKCNTTQHDNLTAELRSEVVQYIEANLEQFKRVIQLRIGCGNDVIDDECVKFLNGLKGDSGPVLWGGMETVYAVMNMYRVNIIIFNEEGPFYCGNGFKKEFQRTIFMAYRIGYVKDNKNIYDHYDSIHSLDEDLLYKCANVLSTKMG